jgi:hypothetical protein
MGIKRRKYNMLRSMVPNIIEVRSEWSYKTKNEDNIQVIYYITSQLSYYLLMNLII